MWLARPVCQNWLHTFSVQSSLWWKPLLISYLSFQHLLLVVHCSLCSLWYYWETNKIFMLSLSETLLTFLPLMIFFESFVLKVVVSICISSPVLSLEKKNCYAAAARKLIPKFLICHLVVQRCWIICCALSYLPSRML